jgi:heptaprenyl diphosphate synthase
VNIADLLGLPILDEELLRLEERLAAEAVADDPFLTSVTTHLLRAGGKRIRPALTLAAAATGQQDPRQLAIWSAPEEVLLGGVVVELVHLASLYHDDVIDEASTRRTTSSVNARFGNLVAVVVGDFLLARAASIAAALGNQVSSLVASTLGKMCEGQVAEVRSCYDTHRSEPSYFQAIAGKTAALMACSCAIGAVTARLSPTEQKALERFGECLGMVFQIRDDVLDLVADERVLGKHPGQDLAQGVYTLPVLYALAEEEVAPLLKGFLGRPLDIEEREEVRSIIAASGAIAQAARTARAWADEAASQAASLPPGPVSAALAQLPYSLLDSIPVATT